MVHEKIQAQAEEGLFAMCVVTFFILNVSLPLLQDSINNKKRNSKNHSNVVIIVKIPILSRIV